MFAMAVNAQDRPAESTLDLPLEIAHLLLIDVVGYSKLLIDEQIELLHELHRIVRTTECFRSAEASGHPSLASLNSVKLLDHPFFVCEDGTHSPLPHRSGAKEVNVSVVSVKSAEQK